MKNQLIKPGLETELPQKEWDVSSHFFQAFDHSIDYKQKLVVPKPNIEESATFFKFGTSVTFSRRSLPKMRTSPERHLPDVTLPHNISTGRPWHNPRNWCRAAGKFLPLSEILPS